MKTFLLTILAFTCSASMACRPRPLKELNVSVDIKKGIQKFYTSKQLLDERPKDDAQLERNWIHDASTKRQYFFNVDECGQFGTVEAKRLEQRWKREKFKHS